MKDTTVSIIAILLISLFSFCNHISAQDSKPKMQSLLQSKHYLFTAQYAQPMSGNQITLTSTYTLRMAGDSLVCQLPYYGRVYTVDNYPGGGGFMFTSHHFDYNVNAGKHNRYMVSIKINDLTNIQQMYINVSKNGYANLQITPTNKQSISYYGTVTSLPARR